MLTLVRSVITVCVNVTNSKKDGSTLYVAATGDVPTSGWRGHVLASRAYVKQPADGVLDLDFLAEPPTDFALTVITPISADISGPMPKWVTAVRVHSKTNKIEAKISDKTCQAPLEIPRVKREDYWPWPWIAR